MRARVRERVNQALIFFGLVEDPAQAGGEPRWSERHRAQAVAAWVLSTAALLLLLEGTGDLSFGAVVACVGLGAFAPAGIDWWSDRRASAG
jgi:hypothetical protein